MKLIRGLHNLKTPLAPSVVTLGNFDGIHLGHQRLISCVKEQAQRKGVQSVLVTFEPTPKDFFAGKQTVSRLMRFSEKYLMLKKMDIDVLCVLYFDAELSQISAIDFVKNILLSKLSMQGIVVGYDFHFGAKRLGDFALLKRLSNYYQFEATEVMPVRLGREVVSSTRVRQALHAGDMALVSRLLGRSFSLYGKVIYGVQRGRKLGFPTANIDLHRQLTPISGVFVVQTSIEGRLYKGVANVGTRPTFDGRRILLEVHLFKFNRSIYGCNLKIKFIHKLREEKRYKKFDELVKQINQDVWAAKNFLLSIELK